MNYVRVFFLRIFFFLGHTKKVSGIFWGLMLSAISPVLWADIAPEPTFGQSLTPFKGVKVTMTDERVVLRVGRNSTQVEAVFHLHNRGEVKPFQVGFPDVIGHHGYEKNGVARPTLRHFKAWVDDRAVISHYESTDSNSIRRKKFLIKYKEVLTKERKDEKWLKKVNQDLEMASQNNPAWPYLGWMIWPMEMAAGQRCEVKVTYEVDHIPGRDRILLPKGVSYVLKTGALWHGPIGRAVIDVWFEEGLTMAHVDHIKPAAFRQTARGFGWVLENFEPSEDISFTVRAHTDYAAAAKHHLILYQESVKNREPRPQHLASAAYCEELAGQYDACIQSCKRIIQMEKEQNRLVQHIFLFGPSFFIGFYEPWQCRLARCHRQLGRFTEAAESAREGMKEIERLSALQIFNIHQPQNARIRIDPHRLRERYAECQAMGGKEKQK